MEKEDNVSTAPGFEIPLSYGPWKRQQVQARKRTLKRLIFFERFTFFDTIFTLNRSPKGGLSEATILAVAPSRHFKPSDQARYILYSP